MELQQRGAAGQGQADQAQDQRRGLGDRRGAADDEPDIVDAEDVVTEGVGWSDEHDPADLRPDDEDDVHGC